MPEGIKSMRDMLQLGKGDKYKYIYDFNFKIYSMEEEKCKGGHKVDGRTPMLTDVHLDQKSCDCGRVKYVAEECGCENNKHLELKQYPNE